MKRLAVILSLLGATTLLAGSAPPAPGYVCSLTGQKISACCCTQTKDGKLYCTLVKKTIPSCCCKPTR
jgi:hypothetical protein